MALGLTIAALGLQALLDFVLCGIAYWTGFVILKAVTLGNARLAPFSAILGEKRGRFRDRSSHLHKLARRTASVGSVCLVGLLFYVLVGGLALFLAWPRSEL